MGVVLFAACGVLAVRLWLLPQIDRWRPQIAQHLSQASGLPLELGPVSAQWRSGLPQFDLASTRIVGLDTSVEDAFAVERITGQIRLLPLLHGDVVFERLDIDGLNVAVDRLDERSYRVAGRTFELDPERARKRLVDYPFVQWLHKQNKVSLTDATVQWNDGYRQSPPLELGAIRADFNRVDNGIRLSLSAAPQPELGGPISIDAQALDAFFSSAPGDADRQGQIEFRFGTAHLEAWAPWGATGSASGKLQIAGNAALRQGGIAEAAIDLTLERFAYRDPRWGMTALDRASASMSGSLSALMPEAAWLTDAEGSEAGLRVKARVDGFDLHFPKHFAGPAWHAHEASVQGQVLQQAPGQVGFALERGHVASDDLNADIKGQWQPDGIDPLGAVDLTVDIERADIAAIYRYVPAFVDLKVRDWLRYGLVDGTARQAHLALKGRLNDFPFDDAPGYFRVAGAIDSATVDYLPIRGGFAAQAADKAVRVTGWPAVENIQGRFEIDRTALTISAGEGTRLAGKAGDAVQVSQLTAHIPDMSRQALLVLDGQTEGRAQAYVDIVNRSPLSGMIGDSLRAARASGKMTMPLTLSIPLTDAGHLATRADLRFHKVGLALPDAPRVDDINGRLIITRPTVRADNLIGRWIGGPVRLSGRIGGGGTGLRLSGKADMAALARWKGDGAALWKRVTGAADYTGVIAYGPQDVVNVDVTSDLLGLSLDLPAPFGKRADAALPVLVAWRPEPPRTDRRRAALTVEVGTQARLAAEVSGTRRTPVQSLDRAVIAVNQNAALPDEGISVQATLPEVDLALWRSLLSDAQALTNQPATAGDATADTPDLALDDQPLSLALRTDRLDAGRIRLTDFDLRANRSGKGASRQWLATLGSEQASGTVQWREGPARSAGALIARLSRLAVVPSDLPDSAAKAAQLSDHAVVDLAEFPAVDVTINDFSYDGKRLGAVNLVGTNVDQGRKWRLDTLTIQNPDARLDAQGFWTAQGADRGLSADAVVQLRDAGAMLGRMGHPQVLHRGEGAIRGRFTWRDSPWRHDIRDIDGDLSVDIKSGRFNDVSSSSVKILELLSLQSLTRIATLKANPGEVAKEGFPFDEIQSHLRVNKGVLIVDDYAIDGPVARIKLVGQSDLADQTWDVNATVIPNLDVSGAALATGFLVNPVVGIGAFVAQWALRNPIESAMTQRFRVRGPWDAPEVQALDADGKVQDVGAARKNRNTEHITP